MSDKEVQVKISASSDSFRSSMKEAAHSVEDFSHQIKSYVEPAKELFEGLAAAFAAEKIFDGIKELEEEFAHLAEQIGRVSQMTGLSASEVQNFAFAVEHTGGNIESATVTLERFEKNLAEAGTGTGRVADIFKTLGVNVSDANGKIRPLESVLGDLADKFKDSEDGVTKTAYAMELMGRGGAQLIPVLNKGREGLEELNKELEKSGSKLTQQQIEKFEELEQEMKLLNKSWEGFKLAIADFFEPAAKKVVEWLTSMANTARETVKYISELTEFIGKLNDIDAKGGLGANAKEALGEKNSESEGHHAPGHKNELPPLPPTRNPQAEKDQGKEEDKLRELAVQRQRLLDENEIQMAQQKNKELLDLDQITNAEYLNRKLDLQKQLDAIDLKAAQDKQAAIQNDVVAYERAGNEIIATKQKQALAEEQIQHQITLEAQKEYLQLGKDINKSLGDAFAGVIDGSKSMKSAFNDFAKSVIDDLAKMGEKNIMESIFGPSTGANSSAGGLGGMLANLLGGGASKSSGGGAGLASIFNGFLAGGGSADAGKGYVVGENGPEFFMPNSSGTVLNQDQMGRMGGNTINMTVNTPNAQSFRQNSGQMMADMQAALRRSTRNA